VEFTSASGSSPYIHSSAVPFLPCVMFLGLDSELSCELHLGWLCIKCGWSQNILKVLPGKSWLIQVYDAMPILYPICIKIGHVNFVCCSTVQCRMPVIDTVHNIWIDLTTGIFHPSQHKSVWRTTSFSCGVFLHSKAGSSTWASILWHGLHLTYY
jgi:hypothetical protein